MEKKIERNIDINIISEIKKKLWHLRREIEEKTGELFEIELRCWSDPTRSISLTLQDRKGIELLVRCERDDYAGLNGVYHNVLDIKNKILHLTMEDGMNEGIISWWKFCKTVRYKNVEYKLYEVKCRKCGEVSTSCYNPRRMECMNSVGECYSSFLTRRWMGVEVKGCEIVRGNDVIGRIIDARKDRVVRNERKEEKVEEEE